jgi:serine/threonine protein kinase
LSNKNKSDQDETNRSIKKEPSAEVTQINESIENPSSSDPSIYQLSTTELVVGTKINRIRIEKLLGKGGMGSVYLGYDEKLKRKVAVKSIRPEHLLNQSTHERFVREAQILSKINHPSICHIYDYIETQGGDFLVLELIHGKELHRASLSYEELLNALIDLANALAAAHLHGIVHRDLKPDNIMFSHDGKVKVLDFGIAQSISKSIHKNDEANSTEIDPHLTLQGSLVGTIRYMSPEQARGDLITTASDIYSLGIIIQELFSHESAYPVMETNQLLKDVQLGNKLNPKDLPKPIQLLITQLCQADPNQRPSAKQVANEITRIKLAPKTKKQMLVKSFVALLMFILVSFMVLQWVQFNQQKNSAELSKSYIQTINALVRDSEQIYALPLHNVQQEIGNLLKQAEILYFKIEQDSKLNIQDKLRLQGLILLESEDYEAAVDLLEKATADNYLLARAWMGLYIEKAGEHADIHGVEKTLKSAEFRQKYLDPTIKYIAKSSQDDKVMQAFVVSQTQSLDKGLDLLNAILSQQKWNKQAIELKSQILLAQAEDAIQKGNWNAAKQYYDQTAATYQEAIQMVRSYPENYFELCRVRAIILSDGVYRTGKDIQLNSQQAIQACENHLITYPDNVYSLNLLTRIHIIIGQWHLNNGTDLSPSLSQARVLNQKALELSNFFDSYVMKASVHLLSASHSLSNTQLAQFELNQAQFALNQATYNLDSIPAYITAEKIYALELLAKIQAKQNLDIKNTITEAEQLYQDATASAHLNISDRRFLLQNLSRIYLVQINLLFLSGKDILAYSNEFIDLYEQSEHVIKNESSLLIQLVNVYLLLAESNLEDNSRLAQYLNFCKLTIEKIEKSNPNQPMFLLAKARYHSLLAQTTEQNFNNANQLFESAVENSPNQSLNYYYWAKSLLVQQTLSQSTTEKQGLVKLGLKQIELGLINDPDNEELLKIKAQILILKN